MSKLKIKPGMSVIIRKPANVHKGPGWIVPAMDRYDGRVCIVGKVNTVTRSFTIPKSGMYGDGRDYSFSVDWAEIPGVLYHALSEEGDEDLSEQEAGVDY